MHFTIISCSMNARTEFREKKKREKKRVRYQFPNGTIDMAVKPMKQKKLHLTNQIKVINDSNINIDDDISMDSTIGIGSGSSIAQKIGLYRKHHINIDIDVKDTGVGIISANDADIGMNDDVTGINDTTTDMNDATTGINDATSDTTSKKDIISIDENPTASSITAASNRVVIT